MGKKVKKKSRSIQKEKRGSSISPKTAVQQDTCNVETPGNVVVDIKDRGLCYHIDKGINLDKLSTKLGSSESLTCEDCRGNVDGRVKKGKGKQGKKGGLKSKSESKAIWICLECGHFSCGGVGLPTILQSHAVRHAKQNHHPLVVHFENHQLLWCFSCNKLIPTGKSEDSKHKDVLDEVNKMLKGRPSEGSTVDIEGVWFGTGSVTSAVKSDYSSSIGADGKACYSVRGLVNLGNTCFFNSVMQNLLAINSFREYFLKLDDSIGPLSASIRKLFFETGSETSSRGAINPRSLFGNLCVKAPQFRGYQQHDSHELLRCLLDGLSSEGLSARKRTISNDVSITDPTFVDTIFGGRLSSTVSCLECGHSSTIYEPFLDLSLPVPTKKPPVKRTQPATRGKKSKLPPKKSGRNLSKVSKEASTVRGDSTVQSTSENSSGEMSIAPPTGQLVLSWSDSAYSDLVDPSTIALDMGFTTEDLSAIQKPKNLQTVQNVGEQSTSSDSFAFSWLDYLDADPASHDAYVASGIDEVSVNQGVANEDSLPTNGTLSFNLNRTENDLANAVSAACLNDSKKISSLEPVLPAQVLCQVEDEQNTKLQCSPTLSAECTFPKEVQDQADLGHSSDLFQYGCSRDSNTSGRDNDHLSEIKDVKPQFKEKLLSKYSCIEEAVHCGADLGQSSNSCKQICIRDSSNSAREYGRPSQIHDSEDRLLPNKEDASSSGEALGTKTEESPVAIGDDQQGRDNEHPSQTQDSEVRMLTSEGVASSGEALGTEIEVSSVALGGDEDSLGFDGFGDLFNEPDSFLEQKPLVHPVSEGSDASKSGVIGNSSESDPDEVDNADAPVSVESCLSLFTKPEFLSKDEHAWECDNCSKVVQEQRGRLRMKAQIPLSNVVPNGCQDINPCGLADVGNSCNKIRTMNGDLERDANLSHGSSLTKNGESRENGKCVVGELPQSEISGIDSHSGSSEPHMINECPESNLDSAKGETEGSEPEEASSENLKVKRDATKSILINNSPSILTIHLKRFSQDTRGRLSKLNGHVNFRETIDLKPYMDSRCTENDKLTYHLVGVVEHLGTMRGGHYVAYVRGTKNLGDFVWYHASDAYVREASLEEETVEKGQRKNVICIFGRPCHRGSQKVTILGTAGGIGQPLSLLLKLNPLVSRLALYDIAGSVGRGQEVIAEHENALAQLLRFLFHDCFVEHLVLETECPGLVSCADILTLATRDAIALDEKQAKWAVEEETRQLQSMVQTEMEMLDEKIRLWSIGKEADIRLLLSSLHHVR